MLQILICIAVERGKRYIGVGLGKLLQAATMLLQPLETYLCSQKGLPKLLNCRVRLPPWCRAAEAVIAACCGELISPQG